MIVNVDNKYFRSIDRHVNSERYNEKIFSLPESESVDGFLDEIVPNYILPCLRRDGYCVVDLIMLDNLRESWPQGSWIKWLESFLAPLMRGKDVYTAIEAVPEPTHYFNSNYAQPLHTDEGHALIYPNYVLLHCIKQAEVGGDSIIVQFTPLYNEMSEMFGDKINFLFDDKALKIYTQSGTIEKPLLLNFGDQGVGVTFSPNLHKMTCSEVVFQMYDYIARYIHTKKNQVRFNLKPGQLLFLDNTKVFHGRTAFPRASERILYRYWFGERHV